MDLKGVILNEKNKFQRSYTVKFHLLASSKWQNYRDLIIGLIEMAGAIVKGYHKECLCHDEMLLYLIVVDGGTWWAAVYEIAQSQTQLKQLSSSSSNTVLHIS